MHRCLTVVTTPTSFFGVEHHNCHEQETLSSHGRARMVGALGAGARRTYKSGETEACGVRSLEEERRHAAFLDRSRGPGVPVGGRCEKRERISKGLWSLSSVPYVDLHTAKEKTVQR